MLTTELQRIDDLLSAARTIIQEAQERLPWDETEKYQMMNKAWWTLWEITKKIDNELETGA